MIKTRIFTKFKTKKYNKNNKLVVKKNENNKHQLTFHQPEPMQSRSQLHCHRTWGYLVPLTSALFDERVNHSRRAARRRRHFVAR